MSSTLAVLIAGTFVMVQLATLVMRRAVRDHLPYVLMLGGVAAALAFVHVTHIAATERLNGIECIANRHAVARRGGSIDGYVECR